MNPEESRDLFDPSPAVDAPGGEGGAIAFVPEGAPHGSDIGARLIAARKARGLDLAACAQHLKLPVRVLKRLEANEFGPVDDYVFLRGALTSYARLLGIPPGSFDDALRAFAPEHQPALVPIARTSPSLWLLQRYGTAATYIVLTATVAVPLVWLGLHGGLDRQPARIAPLDHLPAAVTAQAAQQAPSTSAAPTPADDTPLRASMTPFAAIDLGETAHAALPPVKPPAPVLPPGQHVLTVQASADCWIEIADANGNRIDSGLLHAGESRTYHSAGPLKVTLGNAGGATVTSDGKPFPLDAYRRANVARFQVFAAAPAGSEKG